ncbi:hypothetical protein CR513_35947, partial [Mucuna pruriens]
DLGPINKILGMQIHRDRKDRKVWLSQKNYLLKILRRFNMQDCKPISTPLPTNFKLSSKMSPSSEEERMEMSRVPYALVVGILIYVMICIRPDIAQTIGESALHIATNLVFHSKTKHIGAQYHFVRKLEEGRVDMQKIHTKDKLVGVMIKSICYDKVNQYKQDFMVSILLWPIRNVSNLNWQGEEIF